MPGPDFAREASLGAFDGRLVVGLDEVGRGPWAGPVVAAAVALDLKRLSPWLVARIDDSKKLTAEVRVKLMQALVKEAPIAVGHASVEEIDRLNILKASHLAMQRAYEALGLVADHALVDGDRAPGLPCATTTVVQGDSLSLSIAAASIVAKVTRDRMMLELAECFPGYGWERNKGYGTDEHARALLDLGVTQEHRRTFRPIRDALELSP